MRPLSEGPVQIPIFVQALHLISWPHTQSLYLDPSSRSHKIGGYFQSKHQLQVSLNSSFPTFEDFQHLIQPHIFKLWCLKCFIQQLVFFNEIIYPKTWSALCLGSSHSFSNPRKSYTPPLPHPSSLRRDYDLFISPINSFPVLISLDLSATSGTVGHSFSFLPLLPAFPQHMFAVTAITVSSQCPQLTPLFLPPSEILAFLRVLA